MRGFHLEFWVWINDCPKCKDQIPCKSLQSRSCFLSNLLRISSLNSGRGKWCRLGQLLVFLANTILHHLKSDTLASIKQCLSSVWGGLPWTSLMADPICFNSKSWKKHIAAFHLLCLVYLALQHSLYDMYRYRGRCVNELSRHLWVLERKSKHLLPADVERPIAICSYLPLFNGRFK